MSQPKQKPPMPRIVAPLSLEERESKVLYSIAHYLQDASRPIVAGSKARLLTPGKYCKLLPPAHLATVALALLQSQKSRFERLIILTTSSLL